MARLYFMTNVDSDLTLSAIFNETLQYRFTGAAAVVNASIPGVSTGTCSFYTQPLHPGTSGSVTGNYTVSFFVSTANSNLTGQIVLRRIDSTGGILTSSSSVTTPSLATTGVKTVSFTSVNLGTFSSTNRFRVDFNLTNSVHSTQSLGIRCNDPDSYVLTPFYTRTFQTT